MTLPRKPLPRGTVVIEGEEVEVRGLSRSEALHLSTAFAGNGHGPDADGAEIFILVQGAGVSEDEAKAFRDENDAATAGLLIDKIIELSGLTGDGEKDPKQGGRGSS